MDIYEALKNDHEEAKKLFNQLEQPPHMNGDSRDKIFKKLKTALEAHSEAEEVVFYSQLRQNEETGEKIEHAIEEHDKVAKLLEELESKDKNSSTWLNRLMHLHDEIHHHIHQEERAIFQKAQGIFSRLRAEEMGLEFQKAKNTKRS